MMMKNWVLAAALLSLAVSISCSSAHNPAAPPGTQVSISESPDLSVLYPSQQVTFTATATGAQNTAVTWSLSQNGTDCTANPTCGTLSSTTTNPVTYTAPTTAPVQVDVIAALQADNTKKSDPFPLNIKQIQVQVTPNASFVGLGLTQQFTAVVIPDDAPQQVTWKMVNCVGSCGNIDPNTGLYNATGATDGSTFSAQATLANNQGLSGSGTATATDVFSRLSSGTYAFRFSGYDNQPRPTASVGTFTTDGVNITGGTWDELTSAGPKHCTFTGGTFSQPANTNNNQGTLTLSGSCLGSPRSNTYNLVFDAAGDVQMIEQDSNGTGSGIIEPVTGKFNDVTSLKGNFVFGFTGQDYGANSRMGFVGVLPFDGNGNIGKPTSGMTDLNDGGHPKNPATDVTGVYTMNSGIGSLAITSATLGTFNFNIYGVSGQLNGSNPATFYAISADSNSGVSGTVVFQDSKPQYTTQDLKGTMIIGLTGADNGGSNVSLTQASLDGKGGVSGQFDQNDAGNVMSVSSFNNTYMATPSQPQPGRYTIGLLGNTPGTPFVLYASSTSHGFLLDQSSASVMTGTMTQQKSPSAGYASSELPSTYAAATTACAVADPNGGPHCAIAANLLLTCGNNSCSPLAPFNGTYNVSGTQYDVTGTATQVSGTFALQSSGVGSPTGSPANGITLSAPSKQNFALYMLDVYDITTNNKGPTHFLMIDVDSNNKNASIINAQQ